MQGHADSKHSGAHRGAASHPVSRAIAAAARRLWLELNRLSLEIQRITLRGGSRCKIVPWCKPPALNAQHGGLLC